MSIAYMDILQLLSSAINVIGTVYAVLSILKLKPKEIYSSITISGMDQKDIELITQKKQARTGISLILYGWILQLIYIFLDISTLPEFLYTGIFSILGVLVVLIIIMNLNKRFERKYVKFKTEKSNDQPPHSSSHNWGSF